MRSTYGRSYGKPFFHDPIEWRAVLESLRAQLRQAEDAYAAEYLYPVPDTHRKIVQGIANDLEVYEAEGTVSGDDAQDKALVRVLDADQNLKRAELEANQGRLFPEGASSQRAKLFSDAEIERGSASLARSQQAFTVQHKSRIAAVERDLQARRALNSEVASLVLSAKSRRVFVRTSDGRLEWNGTVSGEAEWRAILTDDADLRRALHQQLAVAARREREEHETRQKEREAQARREKLAAAKRPAPAGYVVEKSQRGTGYQVVRPDKTIMRGYATKGKALDAAIQDAKVRGR